MFKIDPINVTTNLISSMNNIFSNLLLSIYNNTSSLLDHLAFIDFSIASDLIDVVGTNFSSGILLICNSLIYGFLIYYAISYLLSHLTFTQVEAPSQFLFRLFLSAIALNCCIPFCSFIIYIFSVISSSIKILR